MIRCVALLSLSILCVSAANFAVIAPVPGVPSSVQVSVGGSVTALTQWSVDANVPYFTGSVAGTVTEYFYIVNGEAENFTRTFPSGRTSTWNDFYGRQLTVLDLPTLPQPFGAWSRSIGMNDVYDDDYILSAFITGITPDNFDNPGTVTWTLFTKDDYSHNAGVSCWTKNDHDVKFELECVTSTSFHGRSTFKFRPSNYDPVFFREKLFNDVLEAIGVPHQQTQPVRLYLSGQGQGLYHLQEDVRTDDFIVSAFYNGNYPASLGVDLEGNTGAEFNSESVGNFGSYSTNTPDRSALSTLMTQIAAVKTYADIQSLNATHFDVEIWLRNMLCEWLNGHWDSYWWGTSNFIVYNDPEQGNKFYFVDEDFDQTFGVGPFDDSFNGEDYTHWVNYNWDASTGSTKRVLIDLILGNSQIQTHFNNDILIPFVTQVWNPSILGQRITALKNRLDAEVQWDRITLQGSKRYVYVNPPTDEGKVYVELTYSDWQSGWNSGSRFGATGLNQWINERWTFLKSQYSVTASTATLVASPPTGNDGSSNSVPPPAATTGVAVSNSSSTTGVAVSNSSASTTGSATASNSSASTTGAAAPANSSSTTGAAAATGSASGSATASASGSATASASGSATASASGSATASASGSATASVSGSATAPATTGGISTATVQNESTSGAFRNIVALAVIAAALAL